MKRFSLVALVCFLLMLTACGGGGGGGGGGSSSGEQAQAPVANAGADQTVVEGDFVTLDGSGSTDADDGIASYAWKQIEGTSVTISGDNTAQATFTAPEVSLGGETLLFQLTVTDKGRRTSTSICAITVLRSPAHTAEDVLYAAYAGIGYGNRDSLTDDTPLYLVMVNDLNILVPQLFLDTVTNDPTKLYTFITTTAGNPVSFANDPSTVVLTKGSTTNGFTAFTAVLTVDFDGTGYSFDSGAGYPCSYTGTSRTDEIVATVTGYFKVTWSGLVPSLDGLWFKDIDISANSGLTSTYAFGTAAYTDWHIAYTAYYGTTDPLYHTVGSSIPVNMDFLPAEYRVSSADMRDYTLGGGFTMNGLAYAFTDGFHYQQKQYDYIVDSVRKTFVMTALNGSLMVPGMSTPVTIKSTLDVTDPIGTDTIVTHVYENSTLYDVWTMGLLNISGSLAGTSASVDVTFDQGKATFSSSAFDEDWTVDDWQEALAPF